MDFRIYENDNPNGLQREEELESLLAESLDNCPEELQGEVATDFIRTVNNHNWRGKTYSLYICKKKER